MTIMFIPVSNWNRNVNQGASVTLHFIFFLVKKKVVLAFHLFMYKLKIVWLTLF